MVCQSQNSMTHRSASTVTLSLGLPVLPNPSPHQKKELRRIKSVQLGIAVTSTQNTDLHICVTFSWGLTMQDVCLFVATQFSKSFKFLRILNLSMQYSLSLNAIESKISYFSCVVQGYFKKIQWIKVVADIQLNNRTIILNKNLNIYPVYFIFLGVRNNQVTVYRCL